MEDIRLEEVPVFVRGGGGWRVDPPLATLVLRGPVSRLSTLSPAEILSQVRVEVTPCEEGEVTCERGLDVSLPPGLALKGVDPETVVLTWVEG